MKIEDVRRNAYSMPLTNPAFPPGPYKFFNREYFVITYRTDPEALAAVVPEPLEVTEPVVKYEFIRMPNSTGFGDYTETGQVIPVRFNGEEGAYTHAMYLDDEGPIAGGRELWGFPKKLARPKIEVESDVLVGTLHYGSVLCASATMGYKHRPVEHDAVLKSMKAPNFILKIIPHVDGSPADLRTGAFLARRHHLERGMDRPRRARPVSPRALRCGKTAGARGGVRAAFQGGSDAGTGERRIRLYEEVTSLFRVARVSPRSPGIHTPDDRENRIPVLRQVAHPGMTSGSGAVRPVASLYRTSTFRNCQGSLVSMSSGNSPGRSVSGVQSV